MQLHHRVAIVTGAGSGIGQSTALALAAAGAKIVVADFDAAAGAGTVEQIACAGGEATFIQVDVSNADNVQAMVRLAEQCYGGLDILHNNAGLMFSRPGFAEHSLEELTRMVAVNFGGVLLGTHCAIPAMQRRGGGVIIQTSSVAGLVRYSAAPVYAASKAAIVAFTRSLGALAGQMNIRVNCVCPGSVDTPGVRAMQAAQEAKRQSHAHMQFQRMPANQVSDAVLQCILDDTLAGAVLKIMPEQATQVLDFPDWGIARP